MSDCAPIYSTTTCAVRRSRGLPMAWQSSTCRRWGAAMMNPFDDADGHFSVLVNGDGQYSLWPEFVAVPAGWTAVFGVDGREECLRYIEEHWLDMRSAGLVAAMVDTGDDGQRTKVGGR
jgi:MbtH protein